MQCMRKRAWELYRKCSSVLYATFSAPRLQRRRVVVTGLGLVTPLGVGVESVWKAVVSGKCGITKIKDEDYKGIPAQIAAFVPRGSGAGELDAEYWFKSTGLNKRSSAEESLYAVVAATEAFTDCGWKPETEKQKERTGVSIGVGMSGMKYIPETEAILRNEGYRKVSPFFVPRVLLNMPAGAVSITFGLQGPNHAVSTACAASAHAIGDAFRMVLHGDADVMVAGGAEACITPLTMAGFCKARALTTKFNDRPQEASRPFDKDRSGFVIGEGSGMVILEEYQHAVDRGARIYVELLGYGLSGDAFHITAPADDGRGAVLAMKGALRDGGLDPSEVHYINAHATSTPLGDAVEGKAIRDVFGSADQLLVSSTKGAIGHLLGAAGAVETVFTILAVQTGVVPPTLNLHSVDAGGDWDLNYVTLEAQELPAVQRRVALTNSFGFGGTNACLCVGQL